jgi:ABC-2 type transport system ATP-binding protein
MLPVLDTDRLTLNYGGRRGIRDVSLSISAGEIFGFLGPNGAGKSTTIRILMGLLKPQSGAARIFGLDCWKDGSIIRRDIGYVAGDVRLYPWLTTRRALKMLSQIRGRELMSEGLRLADRFCLEPDLPIRKMSRGTRQKTGLVLALAHAPRLVILDEPTSGLDPLMQERLLTCLREMAAAGHTVMFSSHTLSEVETLCGRVAIVRDGRIVEDSLLCSLQQKAPRQIVVTLRDGQSADQIRWPAGVQPARVVASEGMSSDPAASGSALTSSMPLERQRVCRMELRGPSVSFLKWAATQDFADVSIGAPSLDLLFREYYDDRQFQETDP